MRNTIIHINNTIKANNVKKLWMYSFFENLNSESVQTLTLNI